MSAIKNGVGSYTTKAGEKRYRVVMRVDDEIVRKSGFTTKGAAEHWRDLKRAEVRTGDLIPDAAGRRLFGDFAAEWIATANLRANTRTNYTHLLDHQLAEWKTVPLAKITPAGIRKWEHRLRTTPGSRTGRPPAEASVSKALRLMKQLCALAVADRLIRHNPCDGLKISQDKRPPDLYCPTFEDVLTMANTVPDNFRALVLLCGLGGLRWGEVIGLTRRNVDVENGQVHIRQIVVETSAHEIFMQDDPKTQAAARTVELHPGVLPAVAAHLLAYAEPGDDGLLFYASRSADGARPYLRRSNFYQRVWKPALKASGLPRFRVHDLRHAAATMAAQTGSTTAELMAHLGHSTPAAAMRYQHASQERLRTMAERMGDLFPLPAATGTDNVIPIQRRS